MKESKRPSLPWLLAGATVGGCAAAGLWCYRRLVLTPALSENSQKQGVVGTYTKVGSWRIYARSVGDENANVIVLVHGLVISSRYMEPLALALAANGYRVFAPDLPGYGESVEGTSRSALPIPALADALFCWLGAVGIQKATFIGNSFGCQVLTMLALRHPSVVQRLVLQGPTVDANARSLVQQVGRAIVNGRREQHRSSAGIGRIDYAKCGPWRALSSMRLLVRDKLEQRLPLIKVPCLVVQGSRDPVVPLRWAQRVCDLLPDGRLLVIEGATHTLNYVYPFSFAHAIDTFVREDNVPLGAKS